MVIIVFGIGLMIAVKVHRKCFQVPMVVNEEQLPTVTIVSSSDNIEL